MLTIHSAFWSDYKIRLFEESLVNGTHTEIVRSCTPGHLLNANKTTIFLAIINMQSACTK